MIEVRATVSLPRLARGQVAVVDENDPAIIKQLRWGGIVATGREVKLPPKRKRLK